MLWHVLFYCAGNSLLSCDLTHAGPGKAGHKGDLPHIMADAEGVAKAKLHAPNLQAKDLKGHSVMIHEGGDNYTDNPPLGGGGARIACGVIK